MCSDEWDTCDATVLCQQLGFRYVVAMFVATPYGIGSGPIWLDEVSCNGTEANLTECDSNHIGDSDCSHAEDVGVFCSADGGRHFDNGSASFMLSYLPICMQK